MRIVDCVSDRDLTQRREGAESVKSRNGDIALAVSPDLTSEAVSGSAPESISKTDSKVACGQYRISIDRNPLLDL